MSLYDLLWTIAGGLIVAGIAGFAIVIVVDMVKDYLDRDD